MTLPYVASPPSASRHGTSGPGMSGVSRPAAVANAAPAFGQCRSPGFFNARWHLRWLWTSQICRRFHSQGRAFAAPVWCVVRRGGRLSDRNPSLPRTAVPVWWAVRGGSGPRMRQPACPRTSVPVRWAGRGEVGPRVELAACPRCCLCRCHAGHLGALQKPELREPEDWAKAPDTVRL